MNRGLYMDVHVPAAITKALRQREVDVLTSQEDETRQMDDAILLGRATVLGYLMITMDEDFLIEAARRQQAGVAFATVVFIHAEDLSAERCVEDLEILAKVSSDDEARGRVIHLPMKSSAAGRPR